MSTMQEGGVEALTTVHKTSGKASPVSTDAGVPLHRQLFLVLHDEIDRGVIAPGEPLPSEQTLCDQFGVSRITVRRALADLAEQGYIERRQGVGSFVREHGPADASDALGGGGSYMAGLRQSQFETEVDVVELGTRRPPRAIAEALRSSGELLHIVRVRRQRRTAEPLMVTDAWLPADLAGTLTESALRRAPLYQLLSDAGIAVGRMRHEITAEIAGPRNAHLLDTAIGAALLRVNRLAFVADAPHHHLSVLLSPNRSRVLLSQTGDELEMADGLTIAHDVARPRANE
ncbi:MAG TPA: GntR family transcriptional regulator [Mycobacterium sp.]|nr:GntR family transcriptional regulator [Mycobacterium sp.]